MATDNGLDGYILSHIEPEHPYLHALWRATHLHLNYPRMASGHLQGAVLRMFTHMVQPRHVLEIGTYTGYSTLAMASALSEGATIHTIEINDEQELFTRPWLERSPWADHVRLHIGDALLLLRDADLVQRMGAPFDMVFIDADKRCYLDYYRLTLPLVRQGGYILADNTLWDGHVADTARRASDRQTAGIRLFNDTVAADPAVETVLLPLRDGLTILRKL